MKKVGPSIYFGNCFGFENEAENSALSGAGHGLAVQLVDLEVGRLDLGPGRIPSHEAFFRVDLVEVSPASSASSRARETTI